MKDQYQIVETGEPYQPVRLSFTVCDKHALTSVLDQIDCFIAESTPQTWKWQRIKEAQHLQLLGEMHLESNTLPAINLGLINMADEYQFYIHLPSFERAYLALPYLYRWLNLAITTLNYADLANHFTNVKTPILENYDSLFQKHDLSKQLKQGQVRNASKMDLLKSASEESMFQQLNQQADVIYQQPFLKVERYLLDLDGRNKQIDQAKMLLFTNALMLREAIARKHWFGEKNYGWRQAISEFGMLSQVSG